MPWVLSAVISFLLGSMPFGLWVGRLVRGIDVRQHGSGNLGATNVYRLLGPGWGITVLLLDAAKGAAAVYLARRVVTTGAGRLGIGGGELLSAVASGAPSGHTLAWAGLLGLAGAVLGHTFSPLAGFRGGKGVAAAAGAWAVLAPVPLGLALLVWILTFAFTRIVSLSSVLATLVLVPAVVWAPATHLVPPRSGSLAADPVFWCAVLTALLLVARHRSNLRRLRQGTEKPLALRADRRTQTRLP